MNDEALPAVPGTTQAVGERPFIIDVPEETLKDLTKRLERTRWVDAGPHSPGWTTGTDANELRELCDYWRTQFDWRAQEAALNCIPQFVQCLDGIDTHYVHVRSPHPGALPLVLTHGWPSTFAEFRKVVLPLADPVAYGGSAQDAFHVVCPSLPGFGFSAAPLNAGFTVERVGRHVSHLMASLGYSNYGAQGGDWGSLATCWMAVNDPEPLVGIHLSTMHSYEPGTPGALNAADMAKVQRRQDFHRSGVAYAQLQGSRPECLSPALNDSPVGLAAWLLEKYHAWSDIRRGIWEVYTRDELLTQITLYWVTHSIGTSIRLYWETFNDPDHGLGHRWPRIEVPTAGASFPCDLAPPVQRWAEETFNITRWTDFDRGGHFPAMEVPDLLIHDIRAFFARLRDR